MLGQLSFAPDGQVLDKVEMAIRRLKAFEPPEGYFVGFSGGKDSQCVYHLCQMAGVKFDAHYCVTSVDPPELVRFIQKNYPDAWENRKHTIRNDGTPYTMWNLIPEKRMPPTRIVRYCCEVLKESAGAGRVTVTGVRWAEGANRRINQGAVTITSAGKKQMKKLEGENVNFTQTKRGGVVLNDDNDASRRAVEQCYRTNKTLVNPIIDWEDEDVWQFLSSLGVDHCCLYDEGLKRLGCIGCPMQHAKGQERDFEKWPKYKDMYRRAFEKMIQARKDNGLPVDQWKDADNVMKWWMA